MADEVAFVVVGILVPVAEVLGERLSPCRSRRRLQHACTIARSVEPDDNVYGMEWSSVHTSWD
jgi:hypothetical protein